MTTLTDHQKLTASPVLVAAKLLGFTVRGFRGIDDGVIDAAHISLIAGDTVDRLEIGTDMDGAYCAFTVGGEPFRDRYTVSVNDDGELRLTPPTELAEPGPAVQPLWHT